MRLKVNRFVELNERQIVFIGEEVVVRMNNFSLGASFLERVRFHHTSEIVLANPYPDL